MTRLTALLLAGGLFAGLAAPSASAADATARYQLHVSYLWGEPSTLTELPEDPHFSALIGASHRGRYVLFADGRTASSGLELVAENGRTTILEAELAEAVRRGRAGSFFVGPASAGPGTVSVEFTVTEDHPLVSFVTMIAPSPDWFTGATGITLLDGGEWVEAVDVPLWAWDAGTDAGDAYEAGNADSQPRQSVRLHTGAEFLTLEGLVPVGSAKIRRLDGD